MKSAASAACGCEVSLKTLSVVASIFLLCSCVGRNQNSPMPMEKGNSEVDTSFSSPAGAIEAMPVVAKEAPGASRFLTRVEEGLGLELIEGEGVNSLVVYPTHANNGVVRYDVKRLAKPDRLVIDMPDERVRASKVFETADTALVSKIRVGAHADKSRIVVDIADGEELIHDAVVNDGKLIISLTSKNPPREQGLNDSLKLAMNDSSAGTERLPLAMPKLDGDMPDTQAQPSADSAVENAIKNSPARLPEMETAKEEMPPAFESPREAARVEPAAIQPRLMQLSLENAGGGNNMLVAQFSAMPKFQMKKTAPSEYVITIKGADIDASAVQTLLSPPGSGLIRSVRPISYGDRIVLRVFTSPEAVLSADQKADTLVVAGKLMTETLAADFRAQADPEKIDATKIDGTKVITGASGTAVEKTGEKTTGISDSTVAAKVPASGTELDAGVSTLLQEQPKYSGRLISLDLQDTDIDNALRIIAEVSNLNIIASQDVAGKVTLRLIDVPWDQALDVILKTNALDKVQEGNVVRIAPVEKLRQERESLKQAQQAAEDLEPLSVRYVRVSYAKASEIKPLVESVLSERGSVSYDERTNQLIIKDILRGIKNVAELVAKIDLRTPQVLLETQIVEANRSVLRNLGAQTGFRLVQSPATGNATGSNFPNSVDLGGGLLGNNAASFGAVDPGAATGSAIQLLLESADGATSLSTRLSALETEGRVRVISRPAVATTNNKQAQIKSVEKIRVKLPSGGNNTVVGGSLGGGGGSATETIEIGIILEVTPQASPDYFVLLDIKAKSSTLGATVTDGIPSEIERSSTSSVLVSSGQTFAMGGIYKITDNDTVEGMPFIKDIPFLGHFFRRTRTEGKDEELLFFITPRIIEGSFDDAAMRVAS